MEKQLFGSVAGKVWRSVGRLHSRMKFFLSGLLTVIFLAAPSPGVYGQAVPGDYQEVLSYLGRKGDFSGNVLKVGIPRNDVQVSIAGISVPTSFGFAGWIAMTKGEDGNDVMMGDLVLLQDEVNPVMSALLDNGLDATALHNHFFWDEPRMFYMHVHGYGKAMDLARRAKPALDLIGHVAAIPPANAISVPMAGTIDTDKIAAIAGHKGEQAGPVYKISLGRDDLAVKEHGAIINARMGLNSWAAFYGANENAIIAGDIAMLEGEVTPVLHALRKNKLDVVAIHHHMTGARPTIIFLHYWGKGQAEKLAAGFKAALDELGKPGAAAHEMGQ
ncbi:MAG: DUF1259 domain-containing protein [Candidatus Acidiferrales bacterium]